MARQPNTTCLGGFFVNSQVELVWRKAQVIPGYDSSQFRKDSCGAWIQRSSYGMISGHGWEIDHIKPVSKGGKDELVNLQPLQWHNNRGKGDNFPNWACAVSAKV